MNAGVSPETPNSSLRGRIARLAVLAVTVAAIGGAAYSTTQPAPGALPAGQAGVTALSSGSPPRVGSPGPVFVAADIDDTTVDFSTLAGHPIWLTVGASWCQSCRAENPDIEAAFEAHREAGLVLVAVFVSEDAKHVREYASRVGLTYRLVADPDDRVSRALRVVGLPSHFFIDRQGVLRSVRIGSLTPAGMDAALREIAG